LRCNKEKIYSNKSLQVSELASRTSPHFNYILQPIVLHDVRENLSGKKWAEARKEERLRQNAFATIVLLSDLLNISRGERAGYVLLRKIGCVLFKCALEWRLL
jgi:hypothetical protein